MSPSISSGEDKDFRPKSKGDPAVDSESEDQENSSPQCQSRAEELIQRTRKLLLELDAFKAHLEKKRKLSMYSKPQILIAQFMLSTSSVNSSFMPGMHLCKIPSGTFQQCFQVSASRYFRSRLFPYY